MGTARPPIEEAAAAPDSAELVARVRDLHPILAGNGPVGEQYGQVSEESVRALTGAGMFRLTVPKRYNGYQASVRTNLDVTAALAEADGGTAWLVALASVCNWLVSLFPAQAQDEVFGADPTASVSGVLAATSESLEVRGGWRVTGKWYHNSGSRYSTWSVLGVPLVNASGQIVDQGLALIPRSQLRFEDTWLLTGMTAAGSNAVSADDVFVPAHRIIRIPDAIEGDYPSEYSDREPLYRSAFMPMLALLLIGPQLGLGTAALEYVIANAAQPISYTFLEAQRDSVAFQLHVAEAARLVDTARLHAYRAACDVDEAAARGLYPDVLKRARVRSDAGYAGESISKAIDTLVSAHGASSFTDRSPLQRIWRDAATAARHAFISPQVGYEVYGKALLGIDETITPFV